MSRRKNRRAHVARDALAETIAHRVKQRLPGDYDLGVKLLQGGPGLRVRARIDDAVVDHVIWPDRLSQEIDHLVDRLVGARLTGRP